MEEQFFRLLTRLQSRLRWVAAWQSGLRWAHWGCWLSILAAAILKLMDAPSEDLWNAPWIAVVFALCGFCRGWGRAPSLRRAALLTDAAHKLQERLVSVLEQQQSRRPHTGVAQFLLQDGLQALQEVDPGSTFPNSARPLGRLVLPLLLVAAVNLSPSWGNWLHHVSQGDRQAIHRSGQRLEQLAKRLREQNPASPGAHRVASRLEQLAHRLRTAQRDLDRGSAALELSQTLLQLRRERERATLARARSGWARGGDAQSLRQLAKTSRSGTSAEARSEIDKALREVKPGGSEEKDLREASQKLAQGKPAEAAQRLEQMAQSLADQDKAEDEIASAAEEGLVAEELSLEPGGSSGKPGGSRATSQDTGGQQAADNSGGRPGQKGKNGPADFGLGSTNEEQKPEASATPTARLERQAEREPSKQESFRKLYGAQREHFQGADVKIAGQRGKGRVLPAHGSGWGQPRAGGQSSIEPEQLFLESQAEAEQAMAQGSIPGAYQDVVRNYFQNIDPRSAH